MIGPRQAHKSSNDDFMDGMPQTDEGPRHTRGPFTNLD